MLKFPEKTSLNQLVTMFSKSDYAIVQETVSFDTRQAADIIQAAAHYFARQELGIFDYYCGQPDHYTFIGTDIFTQLIAQDQAITLTQHGTQQNFSKQNPFELLKQLQKTIHPLNDHPGSRLTGSPVGYLSYHAIQYIEDIHSQHENTLNFPDVNFYFFGSGIYLDYQNKCLTVSKLLEKNNNIDVIYEQSMQNITEIIKFLFKKRDSATKTTKQSATEQDFSVDVADHQFATLVRQAKEKIYEGEAFQIVLSRTFSRDFDANPLRLFQIMQENNASPYHFYLKTPDYTLVGASPEKIVRVKDHIVTATPLAGTRAYSNDKAEKITELMNDEKECAEHMMLVDLARNDLGKVAKSGSVQAKKLAYPLVLKTLIHIASDITGELDTSRFNSLDALVAAFPAGTLSGAPKIRAMQLIDELETSHRGAYGGCLVAIDHDDNLDSCIIIRNALIKDKKIFVRAGCGIVHDSEPQAEVMETRHKASAILKAITLCQAEAASC